MVFDAFCKTDTNISLNDCLSVSPVDQDDLISIVIRLRKHRIFMTVDVKKCIARY